MAFRARKGFAFVSFSALFALAACGDEASSPSPATLPQVPPNTLAIDCGPFESFSAEAACEQFARVSCDFEARCDPRNRGGWGGDCNGRLKQNCLKLLAAPSFGYTPAYIAARAAVLASAGCAGQDRTEEVTFSCFDGKGSYSTGTPCLDSSQCQSGVCLSKNGGSCGVCSDPQSQEGLSCEFSCPGGLECVEGKCVAFAAGSACNSPYQCPTGLGCVDGKCAPLLAEGQACTPLSEYDRGPCQPGFYCTGSCKVDSNFALDCSPGVCKPQGAVGAACTVTEEHPFTDECLPWLDCVRSACSEPVVAPGTPCVLQDDCSHLAGLYCENGACKQLPLAQEGQPCQDLHPPYQSCSPELVCVQDVCVKPFQDGQACDSSSRCLLGSECTEGVCKPTVLAETCEPQGAGGAGGAGGASGGGGSGNEGGEGGAAGMSGASGQGGSVSATCATQEECASFKTAPGQGAEPPAPSGGGATDGPAPLLHAVSRWFLGETDRQGTPDPDAWKAFGFDVDGWSSTPQQGFHCLPAAGAKASDIRMDGDKGIDNAFGKGFVNGILATLVSDASGEFSLTATEGKSTVLLDLGALGSASNYASTPSQWFHVAGDGPTPESDWSSYEWHPFADKVESSASSKTKFPGAYMSGDVWVSGEIPALEMPFDLQGLAMHFAVKKARLMLNVKDRTRGVDGVLAGVVPTEALVTSMVKLAGNFGSAFCDEQSAPLQGIIEAIRQTSDILVDGTQDPTRVCDGISLGVGFETRASKLGAVVPAQQIIDPCL